MEFRVAVCATGESPALADVAGFVTERRRLGSSTLSWYRPSVADDSVHLVEFSTITVLYLGEPIARSRVEAVARALSDVSSATELGPRVARASDAIDRVFTMAVYDAAANTWGFASDELGVRPWYWHARDGAFFLSTTRAGIRMLTGASPDLLGVAQLAIAGYTVGRRSTMDGVQRNLSGEVLTYDCQAGRATSIMRPAPVRDAQISIETAADALRGAFREAVVDRMELDRWNTSFLSGGLDSRMVVSSLVESGRRPITYTLTHAHSLDVHLARGFADVAGVPLHRVPFLPARRILWAGRMRRALEHTHANAAFEPTGAAWSGDGGSVCAGGVNVTAALTATLNRANGAEEATRALGLVIPRALVSGANARTLRDAMIADVQSELARVTTYHGELTSYDLLLANDQRQHLDTHFEGWAAHRLSYFLPFYDARVLRVLRSLPESMIECHRVYAHWLARMPAFVTAAPWQTYPGHEPCPLPLPDVFEYQFSAGAARRIAGRMDREFRRSFSAWLRGGAQPLGGISRARAVALGVAHLSGVRRSELNATILNDLVRPDDFGGLDIDHEDLALSDSTLASSGGR